MKLNPKRDLAAQIFPVEDLDAATYAASPLTAIDYDSSLALVPADSTTMPLNMYEEFLDSDLHLFSGDEPENYTHRRSTLLAYIAWLEHRLWSAAPTEWECPL